MSSPDARIPFPSESPHDFPNARPAPTAAAQDALINPSTQPESFVPQANIVSGERILEDDSPLPPNPENAGLLPEVMVEHRRAGQVEITGVECAHVRKNFPAIADALRESDVLAIESGGLESEEHRHEQERLYEKLLSSEADPEEVERAFAPRLKAGATNALILTHLRGSDKRIVYIDIAKDDPRYAVCAAERQAKASYDQLVYELAPLEETRAAAFRATQARVESVCIRDEVMAAQLQGVVEMAGQQDPPLSVGVMVGGLHHQVLASVGEEVEPGANDRIAQGFEASVTAAGKAQIAARDGNAEQAAGYVDRALIAQYLTHFVAPAGREDHQVVFHEPTELFVLALSDELVELIITAMSHGLADPTESVESKAANMKATFRPLYQGGGRRAKITVLDDGRVVVS
jgi:hypothetical protein